MNSQSRDQIGPSVPPAHVNVEEVSVAFGAFQALTDVSFTCHATITGIVGPNGAGKSTLLNVLSGHVSPRSGQVSCFGRSLRGLGATRRARLGIGRSFQHPVLPDALTVREILGLAAGSCGRSQRKPGHLIDETIEKFGLAPWLERDVHQLPYGVRKLVDIARAMAAQPEILLSDEPMSGLDDESRDEMVTVLEGVAQSGTRVILVEHDVPRLSRLAQDLVVLDLGRVIAHGEPAAVIRQRNVIEAFIGTDASSDDEEGRHDLRA